MATREEFVRQLPGRITGETIDKDGKLAYVLTLRGREQDIRRARANSNLSCAYSTAWSLYTIQRLLNWEIHMMAPRFVWLRAAVSFP